MWRDSCEEDTSGLDQNPITLKCGLEATRHTEKGPRHACLVTGPPPHSRGSRLTSPLLHYTFFLTTSECLQAADSSVLLTREPFCFFQLPLQISDLMINYESM